MALTFLLRRLSFTADFLQTTGEKLSRALPWVLPDLWIFSLPSGVTNGEEHKTVDILSHDGVCGLNIIQWPK